MIQNKPYIVALTGGIATGKSTVTEFLKEQGFKLIDADVLSREVLEGQSPVLMEIKSAFGSEVINNDGTLNRSALGKIVFNDEEKRLILESIIHPAIFLLLKSKLSSLSKEKVIFIDMALLIENLNNLDKHDIIIDEIWVVDLPKSIQIERVMDRDGIDEDYALAKINSQISRDYRLSKADIILDNSKDMDYIKNTVTRELTKLMDRMETLQIDEKS